ncbi:hypothetical protein F4774DRAFT_325125 [Daldinia eschscholtzii]|nr:hypothetical protein F4774DRAFT_325125 [Daldinia eschscholtzii]
MPSLDEISYSRDVTVAATRDYYTFLTKMYLKESDVIEPPEGGWPNLTTNLQSLGKTDEVLSLLRHLPYIRRHSDDRDQAQGAAECYFADWQKLGRYLASGRTTGEKLRLVTEGASIYENVPPYVVSLTAGGRSNPVFLLDTKFGVGHWYECPGEVRYEPSREPIEDDPYDYAPEKEAEWRADGQYWAIPDFFGELEDQFRELKFIPISSRKVIDVYTTRGSQADGMIPMLQEIYREYGWPNLVNYRKRECLEAVQTALEERYPDFADRRDDE